MKSSIKIFSGVLFLLIVAASCDNKDDYEVMESADPVKIDSVKIINDTMSLGMSQQITTYSSYKKGCQGFYGYDYQHTGATEREVTAYAFNTNGNCENANYVAGSKINFMPNSAGTYSFKFWNGGSAWITKTIVVQ